MSNLNLRVKAPHEHHNFWFWIFLSTILSSCQTGGPGLDVIDNALESDIVSSIRNLPARVFPNEYDVVAYVDRDFSVPDAQSSNVGEFAVVKTYFATNRGYKVGEPPHTMFNERSTSETTFGKNYIILPREPELQPNEPETLFTLNINGAKYEPSLSQNTILSPEEFSDSIDSDIRETNESSALIYVHGFNESYERSVIRAGQISYDLGFPGSTFVFSWPARHSVTTYLGDLERAQNSQRHFELFVNQILSTTGTSQIYIIAHHMGSRIVSSALKHIYSVQPNYRDQIREVILLAPDIEANSFAEEFAMFIGTENAPITLYSSKNDPALEVSKMFNTNVLAGDSNEQLLIVDNVETINAGATSLSLNGHSSRSDSNSILGDLWDLVRNNLRAVSRNKLTIRYSEEGSFWEYPR